MTGREREKGIVVLGTPRSGTTLLRRLLDAHPRIACPGETNLFVGAGKLLREERLNSGVSIGVRSGLRFLDIPEGSFVERLRTFTFGFLDEYAARRGKARWAEKTAFNAFYLKELKDLLTGHCQFICIQRHGLDVAASMHELSDKNGVVLEELHTYIRRFERPLEAYAQAWADLTQAVAAFAAEQGADAHTIRYEDLIAKPDDVLRGIMAFLGEDYPDELVTTALANTENLGLGDWKTYAKVALDSKSIGRWQTMPVPVLEQLAVIVNPTLKACGYETVAPPQSSDASPDEAKRRYELALMLGNIRRDSR